jgi:hypothetical protein
MNSAGKAGIIQSLSANQTQKRRSKAE